MDEIVNEIMCILNIYNLSTVHEQLRLSLNIITIKIWLHCVTRNRFAIFQSFVLNNGTWLSLRRFASQSAINKTIHPLQIMSKIFSINYENKNYTLNLHISHLIDTTKLIQGATYTLLTGRNEFPMEGWKTWRIHIIIQRHMLSAIKEKHLLQHNSLYKI